MFASLNNTFGKNIFLKKYAKKSYSYRLRIANAVEGW